MSAAALQLTAKKQHRSVPGDGPSLGEIDVLNYRAAMGQYGDDDDLLRGREYDVLDFIRRGEISLDDVEVEDNQEFFGNEDGIHGFDEADERDGQVDQYDPALLANERIIAIQRSLEDKETLDLSGLNLQSINAQSIELFRGVRKLDLSRNNLGTLPVEFAELEHLEKLDLSDNDFVEVPESITALPKLRELSMSHNTLGSLPTALFGLRSLEILSLYSCSLSVLPIEIGWLQELASLDLSNNRINVLPQELAKCEALSTLQLAANQISEFPIVLFKLLNLQKLNLAANQLRALPEQIGTMATLRSLDLSGNRLSIIPRNVETLTKLETFNLSENSLFALPPEIGKLRNLQTLDVRDNLITSLPPEFGQLPDEVLLLLGNNRLRGTMQALLDQGSGAVLAYLRSLKRSVPQYEAKLLLIGEGGVGKSTLISALRGDEFVENRPTTHGIELGKLKLPHPKLSVTLQLNSWDFGGQEVYRITHQFFFSRRALYLLAWKPREGQQENSIEEWCRRVQLRAGQDARIIIVATHADERRPEFDFEFLRQKYPTTMVGYFVVDSRSGRGIEELRDAIAAQAAALPQMGELLAETWVEARAHITAIREPYMSRLALERICADADLDERSTRTFATLLHDLGDIIHYAEEDGLRDLVVLNPEWLTKAIGFVLEDETTRERGGVLEHVRLKEIWGAPNIAGEEGYPTEYHPYFLRLMEKFDITYRLPDEQASLVAQLVPYQRPSLGDWGSHDRNAGMRRLKLVCRTSDEAPGLIAWLTVRNHQFSVGRHWRRGVHLEHPEYASRAVIDLAPNNRDLGLTVIGPAPEYFFHLLRDGIEELIRQRWKGLRHHFLVPCGRKLPDYSRCTGHFSYNALLRFRQRGEERIICETCVEWSDVSELLTGFGRRVVSLENLLQLQQQTVASLARIEGQAAVTADLVRSALNILSTEVTDCPRLFTFVPEDRNRALRVISGRYYFLLTLWCEEPGLQHPVEEATYKFRPSKEWVQAVGPYVTLVGRILQLIVPVGAAALGVALSKKELDHVKADLDLMRTLSDKFPKLQTTSDTAAEARAEGMNTAEGAGLRVLRQLLISLDPSANYGGLRRVRSTSGDLLWICPTHHGHYDPGLPELGYATSP